MARFYKLVSEETPDGIWINLEQVVSMYYKKKDDKTYILYTSSNGDILSGDVTGQILNANNDLTMHDKCVANHTSDKFKWMLSSILARLDSIAKDVGALQKKK